MEFYFFIQSLRGKRPQGKAPKGFSRTEVLVSLATVKILGYCLNSEHFQALKTDTMCIFKTSGDKVYVFTMVNTAFVFSKPYPHHIQGSTVDKLLDSVCIPSRPRNLSFPMAHVSAGATVGCATLVATLLIKNASPLATISPPLQFVHSNRCHQTPKISGFSEGKSGQAIS